MKKFFFTLAVMVSLMTIGSFANEIPEFISIGINASSPAKEVSLSASGGVYTNAAFAKPPEEVTEDATEEATEETSEEATEEATEAQSYYIGEEITVTVTEGGTLSVNGADTNETQIDFYKTSEFMVCLGKKYRGTIRLSVKWEKIMIVNILRMDEYLYGVVGREMSTGFPIEALKAQSIAARNYAVCSMGRHSSEGFDLCNGVHCQAYGAVAAEEDDIRQAVDETSGKLLIYDGRVVECYYYSSSGGYTENSENVWVSEIGYLKGKADPFEDGSRIPGYYWEESFSPEEIKECLASRGIDIGDIVNVEVTDYSANQHAVTVKITGTEGVRYYYKDNIRAAFPVQLKSTLFTVTKGNVTVPAKVLSVNGLETVNIAPSFIMSGDGIYKIEGKGESGKFTFSGRGNGHGVGMSQYGAMFMAEQGYTYEEILNFYYTDAEISE